MIERERNVTRSSGDNRMRLIGYLLTCRRVNSLGDELDALLGGGFFDAKTTGEGDTDGDL